MQPFSMQAWRQLKIYINFTAAGHLGHAGATRQFGALGQRGRGRVGVRGAGWPDRVSGRLRPSRLRYSYQFKH